MFVWIHHSAAFFARDEGDRLNGYSSVCTTPNQTIPQPMAQSWLNNSRALWRCVRHKEYTHTPKWQLCCQGSQYAIKLWNNFFLRFLLFFLPPSAPQITSQSENDQLQLNDHFFSCLRSILNRLTCYTKCNIKPEVIRFKWLILFTLVSWEKWNSEFSTQKKIFELKSGSMSVRR